MCAARIVRVAISKAGVSTPRTAPLKPLLAALPAKNSDASERSCAMNGLTISPRSSKASSHPSVSFAEIEPHVSPMRAKLFAPFVTSAFCIARERSSAASDISPSFSGATPRAAASAFTDTPASASCVRIRRSSFTFCPVSAMRAKRLIRPSVAAAPLLPMIASDAATARIAFFSSSPVPTAEAIDLAHSLRRSAVKGSSPERSSSVAIRSSPAPPVNTSNVAASACFSCVSLTAASASV